MVRGSVAPERLARMVRERVRALDADLPLYAVAPMSQLFAVQAAPARVATQALSVLAAFALILAAVGIYAVASFAVNERVLEIGVRMALGAGRRRIRRWVLRSAAWPILGGGAAGVLGALALTRLLAQLYGSVRIDTPVALSMVVGVLALTALAASLIPALRASSLDPSRTLRHD